MPKITINMPPDQTPEEEIAMVIAAAAAYEESHGDDDVEIVVNHPETVDFRAVAERAQGSSRWSR